VNKFVEMENYFIEAATMEIISQEMDVILLVRFSKDGLVLEDRGLVKVNAII